METLEQIKARIEIAVPGMRPQIIPSGTAENSASLLLAAGHALAAAVFLRDDPNLRFDFASNATGVDWPEKMAKEKTKALKVVDGVEKEVEETTEIKTGGYLEAVYHLYSIALKQGPLVIRLRTTNRLDQNHLPSLTPVWRSCEFQEREIFDLYGIIFDSHPDLRRLLMWDEFKDHPMRKDYVEPDDYEYEPTPHDQVLEKARRHASSASRQEGPL